MQPFMKNVAVEYAAKALPDGELAQALQDLKDGKTTIEEVTALIEGGTVSNAKPVYIHPIILSWKTSSQKIGLFIYDNSSTPYTKDTLVAKIKSIADSTPGNISRVPLTGYIESSGGAFVPVSYIAYLKNVNSFQLFAGGNYQAYSEDEVLANIAGTIDDGVNKLN